MSDCNLLVYFAGTFITEWDDGFEKCSLLLSDINLIERFVDQMVNIAAHHSMDGWLINIENKIQVCEPYSTYFPPIQQ